MKNKSLKKMKKVLLGFFVVAIVSLAIANVNLAFNSEGYMVNLSLAGTESLANDEPGATHWGSSGCSTVVEQFYNGNEFMVTLDCADGNQYDCWSGFLIWYNERLTYDSRKTFICY
jgi:hypothetical protein